MPASVAAGTSMQALRRAGLIVLFASGCAHGRHADTVATEEGRTAAKPAARVLHDVPPAELLARQPDEAEVLLRTSVARDHALGPKLEPFVLAWPGWGKTLRRFTAHPLSELDWIDIVGPRDPGKERLAVRTAADDAAIDARLAASSDGSLRVATRPAPHLVTVVPPEAAGAVQEALRSARVIDPAGPPDEGLRALLPHPHAFFRAIPEEAESARLRVFARPEGAVEAELELSCSDVAAASRVAASLREQAERANGVFVRMLTHDLLSGLLIELDGRTARLVLPASRAQIEALAALAAGLIPPEPAP